MSTLIFLAGLAIVAVTACMATLRLEPKSAADFALTVYLLGFAEIVGLVLVLSLVEGIHAWAVLACSALVLAVVVVVSFGRAHTHTSTRSSLDWLRSTMAEPLVAVLAVVVAAGLVYSGLLAVLTPPNDWDAMTYHLARAAFWIQQQAVGYVPETHVLRINVNPPNAEIGALFTMLLSDGDRYVGLVQYTALLATAIGTYGISRRIGFNSREGVFGALLLLTTPVVLLQSSTPLNDLVVASFLVASTHFLLGETKKEFALGGLALALAVGTKFTSLIALPLVALVVLVGQPRRRWPHTALALVGGVVGGSYWLVVNIVKTDSFDGGAGEALDQNADRAPSAILARWTRVLVNFADDMDVGRDIFVYALSATVFVLVALVLERRKGRPTWFFAAGLVAVACSPLVVHFVREGLLRAHEELWLALGEPELAHLEEHRDAWAPSSVLSYYGPLGLVLLLVPIVLVARAVRRRALDPLVLLLSASPFVFAALVAFALSYDPWRGRFFMFSMALAAATWGVVIRFRWLAWGLVSIAVASILLAFVHSIEKPAGLRLLDRESSAGVWGRTREEVQTWTRSFDGTAEVAKFFAGEKASGRVGLRLEEDDWVYPYFGRHLDREVFFVPVEANLEGFDWLVLRAGRVEQPGPEWTLAFESTDGWRVYRQSAAPE